MQFAAESGYVAPAVVGSAYLNNDNDAATPTQLFNVEAANDLLTTQNPPNSGVQTAIGGLGVDAGGKVGFDIQTVAGVNTGYVSIFGAGRTSFGTVSLTTGAVTAVGTVRSTPHVVDIAIPTS